MVAAAVIFAKGVARALPLKTWLLIGLAVAAVAVIGGIYLAGRDAGGDAVRDRQAKADTRAIERNTGAIEAAGVEHLNDERAIAAREKDRNDATAAFPDSRPSDRRIARACEQLRQQGTDPAGVAACRRPAGGAQAPAAARGA